MENKETLRILIREAERRHAQRLAKEGPLDFHQWDGKDKSEEYLRGLKLDPAIFFVAKLTSSGEEAVFHKYRKCHLCGCSMDWFCPHWSFATEYSETVPICVKCGEDQKMDKMWGVLPSLC
jgi:hypothetical protein